MTQPKKPEHLYETKFWYSRITSTKIAKPIATFNPFESQGNEKAKIYAKGYNEGLDKMEAYYKPIVEELVEALKDLSDSIDDGTTLSGQRLENVDKIIAKYKELK